MVIPETVNARWIDTLSDDQLVRAEAILHREFHKEETAEKVRRGARYVMLRGPQSLVTAWLRWLPVHNETFNRRLTRRRTARRN